MNVRSCWRGVEGQGPSVWTIHRSWSSIVWKCWFSLRGLLSRWGDQGPERQTTYPKLHNRPKTRNAYSGALFTRAGRFLLWQLCFLAFQVWPWPMVSLWPPSAPIWTLKVSFASRQMGWHPRAMFPKLRGTATLPPPSFLGIEAKASYKTVFWGPLGCPVCKTIHSQPCLSFP